MRTYFLRLDQAEVVESGNTWTSDVVDLYHNQYYANFSVTKSNYGMPGENLTWIGINRGSTYNPVIWQELRALTWGEIQGFTWSGNSDSYYTDTGLVFYDETNSLNRYVDYSGRIDLVSYGYNSAVTGNLQVYVSDKEDAYFPDEWEAVGPFPSSEEIGIVESQRFARFVFTFNDTPDPLAELLIRVEIDQPVMAPFYRASRRLLNNFPEWMLLREPAPAEGATPELATPRSLGGKFLNAVAGEWLDDLTADLTYLEYQNFIATVDMDQMAWAWKVEFDRNNPVWSVEGDGIELARAADFEEFVAAPLDHVCLIDYVEGVIYVANPYDTIYINEQAYTPNPHHVWNFLDELGLKVDLLRLNLEPNDNFRYRILDVYANRGGVGDEQMKLTLRRELDLWRVEGATPSSDYQGATPEILEMSDIELDPKYMAPDGIPTDAFVDLVERLSREYPTTWGRFSWDRAMWDVGGEDNTGYGVLPYRYDATPLDPEYIQSGVGDGDDLFVFRPDVITGPHEFTAQLKMRGYQKTTVEEYPAVEVSYQVEGIGNLDFYENPSHTIWFTLDIETTDGQFLAWFQLSSKVVDQYGVNSISNVQYGVQPIFSESGLTTHSSLVFRDGTDFDLLANGTGVINTDDILAVYLLQGRPPNETDAMIDTVSGTQWDAWFSNDPTTLLTGFNLAVTPLTAQPAVVFKTLTFNASASAVTWTSPAQNYTITINGDHPLTAPLPVVTQLPDILWHPSSTSRQYRITLLDTSDVPFSSIEVDGSSTWTGDHQNVASTLTEITWSSDHTIQSEVTTDFVSTLSVPFEGIVDENGPWRNNIPPAPGNTNYALATMEVNRDDFGLANSDAYVVTWMGVEVLDDPQVIAWLASNSVDPVQDIGIVYPPNAIAEELTGGVYQYEPFVVYARLRPDPAPQWYPQVHSGYFYIGSEEYYLYANRKDETTSAPVHTLAEIPRQGAPIIIEGYRQVAWPTYDATPSDDATPSFMVDYDSGRIIFDATPAGPVTVSYEISDYNPATPVDLPLNPLFSIQNEGFIFISYNEYTLDSISVYLSPSKLVSDVEDYMMITIKSLDEYGNPKPNQTFTLSTSFGTLSETTVTTDRDGFAVVTLNGVVTPATPIYEGTLTITGGVNATINFEVEPARLREPRLLAVPNSDQVKADSVSKNLVYGRVDDADYQPEAGVEVRWSRARSLYELFTDPLEEGTVTTNSDGSFTIGPFTAKGPDEPGYWFVAAEATVDGVEVGDVVYWFEYAVSLHGVENFDQRPQQVIQMATPVWTVPPYAYVNGYPVYYDEDGPDAAATPVTIEWLPPVWFALDKYTQFQLGLLDDLGNVHKYSKDV